jgi:hypothetical protein
LLLEIGLSFPSCARTLPAHIVTPTPTRNANNCFRIAFFLS